MHSAAPKTPAQRLIELQRENQLLNLSLAEQQAKAAKAELKLRRYTDPGAVSFGGVPAAQIWADFVLWEGLLNDSKQLRAIFELGTWKGGFAWWLWAQCQVRKLQFHTFDAVAPKAAQPPYSFTRMDVFADAEKLISLLHEWEPLVLFCDNGNKPRELRTFGPALRDPGSLLVVHDWGTEIQPEDVPDTVEMVYREFCEELGSMSRVFKRRD